MDLGRNPDSKPGCRHLQFRMPDFYCQGFDLFVKFFILKEIKLTQGKVALVDDSDYDELVKHSWQAYWSKKGKRFYARRTFRVKGERKVSLMHRFILGLTDRKISCDHKDNDGLNNQRSNLRVATLQQNSFNRKKNLNCSSKYKGVVWLKERNKWRAYIIVNGKPKYLGTFYDEIKAAATYSIAAIENFGEFASLNDI